MAERRSLWRESPRSRLEPSSSAEGWRAWTPAPSKPRPSCGGIGGFGGFQSSFKGVGEWRAALPQSKQRTQAEAMGTCTSTPRLRTFLAPRSSDTYGDDWYFDTMNLLLDRWGPSHIQFLRKKFLEATENGDEELDKKGFFCLFAELQDMPPSVAESAFRMFDADGSGKLNFKEFCCALALCCQLMSSDDEKIRFVFDMFDTNDDGLLSAAEVQQLLDHALQREDDKNNAAMDAQQQEAALQHRTRRLAEMKQEMLQRSVKTFSQEKTTTTSTELLTGSSAPLSFDRFYEWAMGNMASLDNLLCTFQLVPEPQRERAVCEEILARNPTLQEGATWSGAEDSSGCP
eukprot:s1713_g5.t1